MRLLVRFVDVVHDMAMHVLQLALPVAALFNTKLSRRIQAERVLRDRLGVAHRPLPCLWAHAASMGELEQLVPVLDRVRRTATNVRIVVTCTSPSGVEHAQRLPGLVDDVAYLAVDTPSNARRWLDSVRPDVVLVDRYDLWRNHIVEASVRGLPILLVNATLPSTGKGLLGAWTADTYQRCTMIVAVTDQDATDLGALIGRDVACMPDSRTDRVIDRIANPDPAILAYRLDTCSTLVVGSSWREDERIVADAIKSTLWKGRCIIVPHEPTEEALRSVESQIPCTRWSMADPSTTGHLLVDSVGQLLSLYALADAVWVGGGFGVGVHSLTEPAAYGLPIACGPNIHRARDAAPLVHAGALTVCNNADDAAQWLRSVVIDPIQRKLHGSAATDYTRTKTGTSDVLAAYVTALLPQARAATSARSNPG